MKRELIEIDGSFGEGGGAILRLSAGYSVLFNQPLRIKNIRANRSTPGLRLQHLLGLQTLATLTSSNLSNCKVGTKEIMFRPGNQLNTSHHVNINTAASIGLLLQPLQIACMGFKKSEPIEVSLSGGGTLVKWAPSLNYLQRVTYKLFQQSGYNIDIRVLKNGFYPKGGARVDCTIQTPKQKLKSINITELGTIELIQGEIIISNHLRRQRDNIGTRVRKSIQRTLKRSLTMDTDIKFKWVDSTSPGIGLILWSETDTGAIISTGTILGEKGVSSEKLGESAASELIKYIQNDVPVDDYSSDQLIPLMGYVKGPSKIKVLHLTSHAKTNLELIKLFTNREYSIIKQKKGIIIEYQPQN